MPRRKSTFLKRDIGVDPRFGSSLVQKMINVIMERGKKNVARSIVYDAIDEVIRRSKADEKKAIEFFRKAFAQIIPAVQVRPRRVGGSVYQIPTQVDADRGQSLALKWLITAAAARPDKTMGKRLASELMDAYDGKGGAVKKKLDVHKMAEANRAFSHYAW
jgi:small subunit ribosomal protein S7